MISKRLDSPLDYKALWTQLRHRIYELASKAATDAMSADDVTDIHRKQGAYRFGYTVVSEMDRMVEGARGEYGPLRQANHDDA